MTSEWENEGRLGEALEEGTLLKLAERPLRGLLSIHPTTLTWD